LNKAVVRYWLLLWAAMQEIVTGLPGSYWPVF